MLIDINLRGTKFTGARESVAARRQINRIMSRESHPAYQFIRSIHVMMHHHHHFHHRVTSIVRQ